MSFNYDDTQVYLLKLPAQVHANLLKAQQMTNEMGDHEEDGLEVGEIRLDPVTEKATLIMRKEMDNLGRRWALNLDVEPVSNKTLGIIAENKKHQSMKLTTMIDSRVTCIAKNYKVDELIRQNMMTDDHRRAVMEFEAPPLDH